MSDMTQSFIEMVEAFKAKPELEARIKELSEDNSVCYSTIEQLRYTLCVRDATIADLRTKLSEVTKERDDASFRVLELEDKFGGIEKLLGVAERLEQARREEHKATVDAMTPKQEEAKPVESPDDPGMAFHAGPIDPIVVEPQGQSDLNPTVSLSETVIDTTTSKDGPETQIQSEPKINPYSGFFIHYPDGEYKGWSHYQKPSWVSWAAFVDAGGEPEPHVSL